MVVLPFLSSFLSFSLRLIVVLVVVFFVHVDSIALREFRSETLDLLVLSLVELVALSLVPGVASLLDVAVFQLLEVLVMQSPQIVRDWLVGVLKGSDQVLSIGTLVLSYESDGRSRVASSPSPADSVHVVLQVTRAAEVDHQLDVLDVQASRADGSGHHDVTDSALEVLNEALAVYLVLASVQHDGLVAEFVQLFEQVVRLNLLLHEDEHAASFRVKDFLPLADQLQKPPKLVLLVVKDLNLLLYVGARLASVAYHDLNWFDKDGLSKGFDGSREGG